MAPLQSPPLLQVLHVLSMVRLGLDSSGNARRLPLWNPVSPLIALGETLRMVQLVFRSEVRPLWKLYVRAA